MTSAPLYPPPPKPTFASKFDAAFGRPSGFDYLRIILAISIIVLHCWEVSYGKRPAEEIYTNFWRAPVAAIVPMFFAISGFLIAASLERNNSIRKFLASRALRIIPPLAGQVMVAALIIGPVFTVLPLQDYFSAPQFAAYFWTILGDVHYRLPGVFLNNPATDVTNAQLWTIPYEIICYIIIAVLGVCRIYKSPIAVLTFATVFSVGVLHSIDFRFHAREWDVPSITLPLVFIAGMLLYRFRNYVPWNRWLFLACAITSYLLLANHNWDAFVTVPISYVTVYLGQLNPPRNKIILSGDYSYSIYLYGLLVQQTVAALGKSFQQWYISLLVALPCTILLAVISWHVIERPALRLRERIKLA